MKETFLGNLNQNKMSRLKMLYIRRFKVISIEQAMRYQLTFYINVYGDQINDLNCRSIWTDKKGRYYRVKSVYTSSPLN